MVQSLIDTTKFQVKKSIILLETFSNKALKKFLIKSLSIIRMKIYKFNYYLFKNKVGMNLLNERIVSNLVYSKVLFLI